MSYDVIELMGRHIKRRRACEQELVRLLREALTLMPLGTKKRADWARQAGGAVWEAQEIGIADQEHEIENPLHARTRT